MRSRFVIVFEQQAPAGVRYPRRGGFTNPPIPLGPIQLGPAGHPLAFGWLLGGGLLNLYT